MVKTFSSALFIIGLGLITISFLTSGMVWPAIALILFSVLFLYASIRQTRWASTFGLCLAYGYIVAGFLVELDPGLLFIASFFCVAGWDLADLSFRIRMTGVDDDVFGLIKSHLVRLGIALGAGGSILYFTYRIPLVLTFGTSAIIIIFATLGLAIMVHRFLDTSQDN